jgi:hypothetical protein
MTKNTVLMPAALDDKTATGTNLVPYSASKRTWRVVFKLAGSSIQGVRTADTDGDFGMVAESQALAAGSSVAATPAGDGVGVGVYGSDFISSLGSGYPYSSKLLK